MTDKGLSERLRAHVGDDHVRGCMGRQYSCDCGYDLKTEGLLEMAADALDAKDAEIAKLREKINTQGLEISIGTDGELWVKP